MYKGTNNTCWNYLHYNTLEKSLKIASNSVWCWVAKIFVVSQRYNSTIKLYLKGIYEIDWNESEYSSCCDSEKVFPAI